MDGLTKGQLQKMKADGMTDTEIAEQYNTNEKAVGRLRAKFGVPSMQRGTPPPDIPEKKLRRLKQKGNSDAKIARMLGASKYHVVKLREKYGINGIGGSNSRNRKEAEKERREQLIPLINEQIEKGICLGKIAKQLKVPQGTIYRWASNGWLTEQTVEHPRKEEYAKAIEYGKRAIYAAIIKYKREHDGNSPSPKTLGSVCGFSAATVRMYLQRLADDGLLNLSRHSTERIIIETVGGQWIPPTGITVPLTLPQKRRKTVRKIAKNRRKKNGRKEYICDCGNEADHVMIAAVHLENSTADNNGWIPLCEDCAELAAESKERVLPLSVRSDERIAA